MATMTTPSPTEKKITPGGSFLISNPTPTDCFFPEDFTEEHRQIAQTTAEFALNEIVPVSDEIEAKDFSVTRRLIKQASDLGLTSVDIPEEYGGLEMDKVTSAITRTTSPSKAAFPSPSLRMSALAPCRSSGTGQPSRRRSISQN